MGRGPGGRPGRAVLAGPFPVRAFRDGEPFPTAARALAEAKEASVVASVHAGAVIANCHFHGGDVEFDVQPREVVDEAAFERTVAAGVPMVMDTCPAIEWRNR